MDNEIQERTPYQVALDIYNSLAHKDHIDDLLWLQDRPLISCCLSDSKIKRGPFPINLSIKDWSSFLRIADPKALKWTFIRTYGWVFDCIKKDFPAHRQKSYNELTTLCYPIHRLMLQCFHIFLLTIYDRQLGNYHIRIH